MEPIQPLMVDGHMNLGHSTDIPMPERFTVPDTGSTVAQQMGACDPDAYMEGSEGLG